MQRRERAGTFHDLVVWECSNNRNWFGFLRSDWFEHDSFSLGRMADNPRFDRATGARVK